MNFKTIISISLLTSLSLFASKPDLFLLKTYKNQDTTNWVMSEKLDGIRAYWDGEELLSRNGKVIHAPKWFTSNYPDFEVDGELWTKRNDFENISSIVRDKEPSTQWKEVKHFIFEVPNAKGGLLKRLSKVEPYENEYLKILPQISIKNKAHQDAFLKEIEDQKGEGIVVRDPDALYVNKRTSRALKVKTFHDDECKIIGYTQGNGKYIGQVGAIKCQLLNKIEFKIGSGLKDSFRKNPPKIGTIVTFKYQNITKYGKPRFPVYLRIREQ